MNVKEYPIPGAPNNDSNRHASHCVPKDDSGKLKTIVSSDQSIRRGTHEPESTFTTIVIRTRHEAMNQSIHCCYNGCKR